MILHMQDWKKTRRKAKKATKPFRLRNNEKLIRIMAILDMKALPTTRNLGMRPYPRNLNQDTKLFPMIMLAIIGMCNVPN